jgi:hypothetical protein
MAAIRASEGYVIAVCITQHIMALLMGAMLPNLEK